VKAVPDPDPGPTYTARDKVAFEPLKKPLSQIVGCNLHEMVSCRGLKVLLPGYQLSFGKHAEAGF
jgi:hypothetical protein